MLEVSKFGFGHIKFGWLLAKNPRGGKLAVGYIPES